MNSAEEEPVCATEDRTRGRRYRKQNKTTTRPRDLGGHHTPILQPLSIMPSPAREGRRKKTALLKVEPWESLLGLLTADMVPAYGLTFDSKPGKTPVLCQRIPKPWGREQWYQSGTRVRVPEPQGFTIPNLATTQTKTALQARGTLSGGGSGCRKD